MRKSQPGRVWPDHQEAAKDAADRASIVAALERQLAKGDKALVGNTGYRRYLKTISQDHFGIDPDKVEEDKRFDGIFVLRTNTDLNPLEAMLCYKQLWTVEQTFRTAKHLFSTRPIFHKLDEPEEGTGGTHCRVRPLRLLAGNHRRSGFAHRDRDRAGRQALHRPLRIACRRASSERNAGGIPRRARQPACAVRR